MSEQTGVPEIHWRPTRTTIAALILDLLALLIVAFLAGYLPLQQREATLRAEADAQEHGLPRLAVMRVERGPTENDIKLLGTMQALTEVPILARTDGYLKRRLVAVRVGQSAALTVSHVPGRRFAGTVARTANALDPATRTMLVEIDVPNADGTLFPGTYADVNLSGSRTNPPLVVPAAAILFRTDGAQVAVVQSDDTVHLQKISVGRDYGDRVEILQGVEEGATIVAAPGDSAREGAKIVPVGRDAQK